MHRKCQGPHEIEWVTLSCGCEIEVCYVCPHKVWTNPCQRCKDVVYGRD